MHLYVVGPYIYGLAWFDKYCVFGNDVAMTPENMNHLKEQVRNYKPHIPYYVCKVGKTATHPTRGRMVSF